MQARDGRKIPPRAGEWLLNLQHSVERMLNKEFLAIFNDTLYGEARLEALRHFDPVTYEAHGRLQRDWMIREVVWPAWLPEDGRYTMIASFPVPIVHWRGLDAPPKSTTPSKTRSPLRHFEMRPHTQYVLICSSCDWPQGPRGGAEIFNSKFPTLRAQLDRVGGEANLDGGPANDPRFLELWLSIEHEVWGLFAFHLAPGTKNPDDKTQHAGRRRLPFDTALGFAGPVHDFMEADLTERLEIVAWILERLQCRNCGAFGAIRYLPQVQLPIEYHLAPNTSARRASKLAERLRSTRPRADDDVRYRVFWFPKEPPRQRAAALAKRTALALAHAGDPPVMLLLADWLIPIARLGEKPWIDRIEIELLERVPEEGRRIVAERLAALREALATLDRPQSLSASAAQLQGILARPEHQDLTSLLQDAYRTRELGERLSDRKYRSSRRAK